MDSDLLKVSLQEDPLRTWTDSLSIWKWQSRDNGGLTKARPAGGIAGP